MLNLDEIRKRLLDRRLRVVADATGIAPLTLAFIRDGRSKNPTYDTISKLSEYFENAQ